MHASFHFGPRGCRGVLKDTQPKNCQGTGGKVFYESVHFKRFWSGDFIPPVVSPVCLFVCLLGQQQQQLLVAFVDAQTGHNASHNNRVACNSCTNQHCRTDKVHAWIHTGQQSARDGNRVMCHRWDGGSCCLCNAQGCLGSIVQSQDQLGVDWAWARWTHLASCHRDGRRRGDVPSGQRVPVAWQPDQRGCHTATGRAVNRGQWNRRRPCDGITAGNSATIGAKARRGAGHLCASTRLAGLSTWPVKKGCRITSRGRQERLLCRAT